VVYEDGGKQRLKAVWRKKAADTGRGHGG